MVLSVLEYLTFLNFELATMLEVKQKIFTINLQCFFLMIIIILLFAFINTGIKKDYKVNHHQRHFHENGRHRITKCHSV